MGRMPRIQIETAVYYILSGGDNNEPIFVAPEDSATYLDILAQYKTERQFKLFAYCLLPGTISLLLEPSPDTAIPEIMHNLNSKYTRYFNNKYNKTGHLFQERYRMVLAEKASKLLEMTAYINLRPQLHIPPYDMATYAYSSYPAYIKDNDITGVTGGPDISGQVKEVLAYLKGQTYQEIITQTDLSRLKDIDEELANKSMIGSETFIKEVRLKMSSLRAPKGQRNQEIEIVRNVKEPADYKPELEPKPEPAPQPKPELEQQLKTATQTLTRPEPEPAHEITLKTEPLLEHINNTTGLGNEDGGIASYMIANPSYTLDTLKQQLPIMSGIHQALSKDASLKSAFETIYDVNVDLTDQDYRHALSSLASYMIANPSYNLDILKQQLPITSSIHRALSADASLKSAFETIYDINADLTDQDYRNTLSGIANYMIANLSYTPDILKQQLPITSSVHRALSADASLKSAFETIYAVTVDLTDQDYRNTLSGIANYMIANPSNTPDTLKQQLPIMNGIHRALSKDTSLKSAFKTIYAVTVDLTDQGYQNALSGLANYMIANPGYTLDTLKQKLPMMSSVHQALLADKSLKSAFETIYAVNVDLTDQDYRQALSGTKQPIPDIAHNDGKSAPRIKLKHIAIIMISLLAIISISSAFLFAHIKITEMREFFNKELARKDAEFNNRLNKEKETISKTLADKYEADMAAYRTSAQRAESEKETYRQMAEWASRLLRLPSVQATSERIEQEKQKIEATLASTQNAAPAKK
ncbi:MAG: transposase [Candidatus Omnitrophica bacterium]|nr:transposase [Candidatus Omnitrophota bacterium]